MINFSCAHFAQLDQKTLYEVLALRQQVFIVEQNCAFLDCDGKDEKCWHLTGRNDANQLVCYARLVPKDITYENYISIGRIVTSKSVRKKGIGQKLVSTSIAKSYELFGKQPIKIGAQSYLLNFYANFGFISTGENYIEDGIPHTIMILNS